jgi:hypothetical protein
MTMNDILKFNLGKNAEIDSITPDGRFLLRYTKANGSINMIAWSENGPNESLESDINGQKIILKLKTELNRRKSLIKQVV